jgi:hypothetical protein
MQTRMEFLMKPLLAAATFAALASFSPPAWAQDTTEVVDDDVCMVIVYGNDVPSDCGGKEIVVVARLDENERYRIPESLRFSEDLANTAWAQRVESLELIGRFGTLSCSTAGAGGFLGCTQDLINRAYGEKRTGEQVRFSDLIAAARADRLAQIDQSAAEEQSRVEQIEREYMERLERERAVELPDEQTEALPTPETGDN